MAPFTTTAALALFQLALLAGPVLAAPLDTTPVARDVSPGELDSRMFNAFRNILTNGASRRVVMDPGKKAASDNIKDELKNGPRPPQGPHQQPSATRKALDEARKKGFKREVIELEERDYELEERDEEFEARMFNAFKNILTNGAARRVVMDPAKKVASDNVKDELKNGPRPPQGPHQKVSATRKFLDAARRKGFKRDFELDERDEELEARMFNAFKNILTNGGARRVVMDPAKKVASDNVKDELKNGPRPPQGPHQQLSSTRKFLDAARRKGFKREIELDERDEELEARMFNAFKNILTNGGARRVVMDPAKKVASDNVKDELKNGPRPAQGPHQQLSATRKALDAARKKGFKRDNLEWELEEREIDDIELEARDWELDELD
ncbi:hypothetical protein AMATHDRAFT_51422 [Amanita thiersii Skay4041]|uniref:Uncharacterized protein n=1 Tax=Amanita thiersii Skay4041 TaxID=703135 RepID=A0A2A9N847_9AGAR|nr:hypothetical protein AMATHDRAFT_51422 [Amanita thiersii Skay4041]